jgi:hypothetical protein
MKIKKCLYIVSTILALNCKATHAEINKMIFKNEKGSILEFQLFSENKIQGSFTTAVSSKECIKARSKTKPITGVIIGNTISFTVAYPECGSILAVVGNFYRNGNSIDTIGILNRQSDDIIHDHPGVRLIEHDLYDKING